MFASGNVVYVHATYPVNKGKGVPTWMKNALYKVIKVTKGPNLSPNARDEMGIMEGRDEKV